VKSLLGKWWGPRAFCNVLCSLVLVAVHAAAAAEEGWQLDQFRNHRVVVRDSVNLDGCTYSSCATLSRTFEVCSCTFSTPEARPVGLRTELLVREKGREVSRWEGRSELVPPVSPDDLEVRSGDLDGDGVEDFVVSVMQTISNGMAVRYDDVFILNGRDPSRHTRAIEVEDFPMFGGVTHSKVDKRLRFLETRWISGSEPKRGGGLYMVGRWMRYDGTDLHPDPVRPIVCRRYLYNFENERNRANEKDQSIRWFADARTADSGCPNVEESDR
jgi:hypothetical protein